jgi:hypothetical protein
MMMMVMMAGMKFVVGCHRLPPLRVDSTPLLFEVVLKAQASQAGIPAVTQG